MDDAARKKLDDQIDDFIAEARTDDGNIFARPVPIPCVACGGDLFFTGKNVPGNLAFIECHTCGIAYTVGVMEQATPVAIGSPLTSPKELLPGHSAWCALQAGDPICTCATHPLTPEPTK